MADPLVPVWVRLSDATYFTVRTWATGQTKRISTACAEAVRVHETGAQHDMVSVRRDDVALAISAKDGTVGQIGAAMARLRAALEPTPPAPAEPPVGAVVECVLGTRTLRLLRDDRGNVGDGWATLDWPLPHGRYTWMHLRDNAEPGTLRLLEPGQVIA